MEKIVNQTGLFGRIILLIALLTLFISMTAVFSSCKKNDAPKNIDLKLVADNLSSPIGVVAVPDNSGRLFIIDQVGKIWIVDASGNKLTTPFMDISSSLVSLNPAYDERGLLGLAFHPNFSSNGKFYIYWQLPPRAGGPQAGSNWNNLSRISEFKVSSSNPNVADLATARTVLEWDDPQSNHNGGTLAFGPDGFLYISIGDGGAADDVAPGHVSDWYATNAGGNGQDIEQNLLGNILRIDVNGTPYSIPPDNPFVNKPGLDEIWAYGFRNPFRMSFDMGGSRQLIAGDAGQVLYEEIDVVNKGGNYGWNVKEGFHCFNAANNSTTLASCPTADNFGNPLIDPVLEINNAANPGGGRATTVIGGNVYRGSAIKSLQGKYVFGSFSQTATAANAELFVATPGGASPWNWDELKLVNNPNDLGYYLKGFGQDNSGELYLTVTSNQGPTGNTGKVYKLIAAD